MIDPCGAQTTHDEVLLRLADGTLLAWLYNVGLFSISAGTYTTTDGTGCQFTVDLQGGISW